MKKGNKTYQIHGEDGPTSVFILKNTKKRTLKQQLHKIAYNRKKKRIEKTITGESHHSMEDVLAFAVNECGLTELDRDSDEVREEYEQLRASFMLQYKPELLGEYAKLPSLESEEPEAVIEHLEKCKKQLQYAAAVSKEQFDIDLHKYYGVTQEDIDGQTERYKNLIRALCK